MSHLINSSTSTGRGGARVGAGRPSVGKKGITLRLTPQQHKKLIALGGSKWVVKRLDELDDKDVFVFEHSPLAGWSFKRIPGYELSSDSDLSEEAPAVTVKETIVFSEQAEAVSFIKKNQKKFQKLVSKWLEIIESH